MDWEKKFAEDFECDKCGHRGARVNKASMSGTGLTRFFDVQSLKYLFVSCENCGYTEVYNLKVLKGKGEGFSAGDVADLLFGG